MGAFHYINKWWFYHLLISERLSSLCGHPIIKCVIGRCRIIVAHLAGLDLSLDLFDQGVVLRVGPRLE